MTNNKASTEEDLVSLVNLKTNQVAIVHSITTCTKSVKRLADLGITPNTQIKIIRKALFHGPVEIEVRNSKLVLGRQIAAKILVIT